MSDLKKNLSYKILYQILLILLPLVLSPYVSRVLGAEGIGVYSYTYSIAGMAALFGMLGVNHHGNRSIAAVRDDREERSREFCNIWFWQIVLTAAAALGYSCYLLFVCSPGLRMISAIQILTVFNSAADINWLFFGLEEFRLTVTRNVVIKGLTVLSVFVFVKGRQDLWIYVCIMAGGVLLGNLALWTQAGKYVDFKRPQWARAKRHLIKLVILFVPVIAVSVYQRMDKVMLGSLSVMEQSGYYENVEKIINIPKGVITALGTVMLPRMSYLISKDETALMRRYISRSMEFVMFSSSAMAFGIAAVANDFAPFFFGSGFAGTGPLIQLMSCTIVMVACANVVRTQYLIPRRRDRVYLQSVWIGAGVNLLVNLCLIPYQGALGAVIGTVAAEGCVMLYQMVCVKKELDFTVYLRTGSCYILCGLIMYIAVRAAAGGLRPRMGSAVLIVCEILTGAAVYMVFAVPCAVYIHRDGFRRYWESFKEKRR
ncbi:MAG: flippase [Enterocloster bolteae]